jgi:hypothetical protein
LGGVGPSGYGLVEIPGLVLSLPLPAGVLSIQRQVFRYQGAAHAQKGNQAVVHQASWRHFAQPAGSFCCQVQQAAVPVATRPASVAMDLMVLPRSSRFQLVACLRAQVALPIS